MEKKLKFLIKDHGNYKAGTLLRVMEDPENHVRGLLHAEAACKGGMRNRFYWVEGSSEWISVDWRWSHEIVGDDHPLHPKFVAPLQVCNVVIDADGLAKSNVQVGMITTNWPECTLHVCLNSLREWSDEFLEDCERTVISFVEREVKSGKMIADVEMIKALVDPYVLLRRLQEIKAKKLDLSKMEQE